MACFLPASPRPDLAAWAPPPDLGRAADPMLPPRVAQAVRVAGGGRLSHGAPAIGGQHPAPPATMVVQRSPVVQRGRVV